MVPPAGYFRFGSSLSPSTSDGADDAIPDISSQRKWPADPSSMLSSQTTDGTTFNSDASFFSSEYRKTSIVLDIPSLRRTVRVKGSSTSKPHSLLITEGASLSSASTTIQESVQAVQSPLESSAYVSASNSLFQSGKVPIYGWWSNERSCMEHFTLSLDELVQYNQACEALRHDLYRQSCAFDCYPPSAGSYPSTHQI